MIRRRTAYDALPRHPIRLPGGDLRSAYAIGGRDLLARTIRDALAVEAGRRASSLAEVRLLREWVDLETEEQLRFWLDRLERAEVAEPEAVEEAPADGLRCAVCSEPFTREPGARGRPPTRCPLHRTPPRRSAA